MMSGNMGEQCKQMMAMHTQMMADMKAMDSSLDRKVAAMNAAKGNAKVDAMAAVINEMATQRTQMMSKMSGMQDQTMAHMGEHMAQSGSAAMKQSMAECPMMKGMKQ
jgi:CII-binding regulator of phage lambda lysogenization HflD